uniref:Calx-beta domain-containing protein n=1 Tax=Clytia hemisphaerica TaxID=252671 RepID=A0A7M5XNC0_9CNID
IGASTNIFTLEDIASGQIAYHHTDGEVGTQKLQDLINLNIPQNDQDIFIGGQLYSGLTLTVDIAPVNSQPPKIDGPLLIEVVESKKSILKINISDSDTSPENINCNVTELPLFGFIENLTPLDGSEIQRPNIPVEKFRVSDLNQGRVSYVQSKHNKIEPDMDSFNLRCFDGNNTSSEVKVHVSIAPINDEPPVLFIQSQIVCIEDDLIIFDLSKINPFDRDRPTDELVFFVTKQPINGELLLQNNSALNPATDFGYEVLSGDTDITLIYQHKGTETTKDQFELSVFDGVHTTEGMVNITIIPMDDEQPRLVVNTGLRIDRGQSKTITTSNLKAQDLDSEDSQLMYIVMMESISGKLQKLNTSQLYTDLVKGNNFTQTDIDKKRIRYTHLNMKSEDRDLIRLDVTDGFNRLINQIFNIIITPEDNIIPVVVNKGLRLLENSRAILTTDVLSASDINTPDENLQFIVTRLPLKGFLEHSDRSGIPLTRFTQLDLAANKISYLHTSLDEIKADNFEFEVTDGQNKVFRTFRIHIDSVDNKLPVLQKSIVYTGQGQEKIITPFELNAYDNDTKLNNVIFQIHRPPRHGVIYLDGITRTFRFTQQDITENRLSYQHDGSMGTIDSFTVAAGDGVNEGYYLKGSKRIQKRPITVQIEITAIDKNAPVIVTNKLITSLRVRRKKIFTKLSINVLEAVDSHSESNSIIFNITGHPKEGKLINVKNKGVIITQFSQDDVNNRIIEYLLNGSSSATNDIFFFDVLDGNGNALRGQNLKLKWSRVCIHQEQFTVQETDLKADLKFKRFGNLQTSAFATMVIKQEFDTDNKAFVESEKVVHWKSGKDIASTSLQLIDDVFYDNMRTVSVTLKDGVNTLIGDGCNMTVSITDPEDEPIVSMVGSEFKINESIGVLKILLQRKGDAKKLTKVYCITESDSARGTSGYAVTSYHDYISRFDEEEPSIVTFEEGEVEKICEIKIIDDTTYEIDEEFKVFLKPLFGSLINETQSDGVVTILNDPKDELEFSLEKTEYKVSEDIGFIRLNVKRTGLDRSFKSYVQIMTKEHVPVSAKSNDDYKGIFKTLEFGVGVTSIQVNLQIYDDEYRPKMEGEESFNVELRNPRNGRLSTTHSKAIVTIHDLENDVPKVGFEKDEYEFDENAGVIKIPIQREGDLSQEVSVLCYTRQSSARVVDDFDERPKSYTSMIKFKRFEKTKYCKVKLVDDNVYEKDEIFYIWLDRVYYNVRITMNNRTRIIIKDNDKPQVFFSEKKYYFYEPSKEEKESIVYVTVERDGDVTKPTSVSLETNDGSAISGRHYEPFARMLKFDAGISRLSVPIKLYHSKKVNVRLAFTLLLKRHPDDALSLIRERKAIVSIEERRVRSDVTFPLNPVVVSLTDYADVSKAKKEAVNGYPLICVTACDTHFPMYDKTNAICNQERIINNMTVYRWQIQSDDVIGGYRDISLPVFFTKTSTITLD